MNTSELAPYEPLTRRQLEVLKLLAQRLSNREIAQELVVTVGTVKWHNRQIYNKLGVRNRREAVALAKDLGLLDAGPEQKGELPAGGGRLAQPRQRVYFARSSDGVRIAYAISGDGPPLVRAAHYLTHLELDWPSPIWRHWMEAFSEEFTFIRYDERGTGLSDWEVDDLSFESWVRDLEAVVDTIGLERFPILGTSQGGPVAVEYAARHPERVSHLILYGSYAVGDLVPGANRPEQIDAAETLVGLIRSGWGKESPAFRRTFATLLISDATMEELESFEHIMRMSATPENAARLHREMRSLDVRDAMPKLTVPTLVIHPQDDTMVPFEAGRLVARLIPNAQFVALESKNHILRDREPAWEKFLREIRHFLLQ